MKMSMRQLRCLIREFGVDDTMRHEAGLLIPGGVSSVGGGQESGPVNPPPGLGGPEENDDEEGDGQEKTQAGARVSDRAGNTGRLCLRSPTADRVRIVENAMSESTTLMRTPVRHATRVSRRELQSLRHAAKVRSTLRHRRVGLERSQQHVTRCPRHSGCCYGSLGLSRARDTIASWTVEQVSSGSSS